MVIFVLKMTTIFDEFSPVTRKMKFAKKKLFRFSFCSAHSASAPVTIKDMQTFPPLLLLRNGRNYMKDAECAE